MTLSIQNLEIKREELSLFHALNFTLTPGEYLQVEGANGSGKSTLLRVIAGLIEPTEGMITWQGKSIFKKREHYHAVLHYIGHQSGVKQLLTVSQNLLLQCALLSCDPTPSIPEVLKKIGLLNKANKLARELSEGQLRRLSLARLLLAKRTIWLLDEPATALDAAGQTFVEDLLDEHLANLGIAIIATHQKIASFGKTLRLGQSSCSPHFA